MTTGCLCKPVVPAACRNEENKLGIKKKNEKQSLFWKAQKICFFFSLSRYHFQRDE
jgi:hypothetical protein